ncbi:MAG: GTPase Era [Sandaracinaceae bacterium]|nr:GTPase Era [Sandaracinaceae bacterium]
MSESQREAARAGRVAIVGRPNVGKSTLLNALLGQKLAITAPRPGTTRSCLLGVYASADPPVQIAFVDTPGLERPRSVLGRVLVEEAQASLEDADAVLVVVEAKKGGRGGDPVAPADADIVEQVARVGHPIVLALNKVDAVKDKSALLPVLEAWSRRFELAAIVPISALRGDNLEPLVRELRALLPEGLLYEEDFLTDKPERFFVAELVREAIIHHTRQEVPYSVAVQVEQMREEERTTRIGAAILVDRPSHKGIVIGAGGARLKAIGTDARKEIEALLGRKVFLELFVKVEEDWTRDAHKARRLTREPSAS